MNELWILFFVVAVPATILMLIPKVAQYGALLMGLTFIPLGFISMRSTHSPVFGVLGFVLAAVAIGRFAYNRTKRH